MYTQIEIFIVWNGLLPGQKRKMINYIAVGEKLLFNRTAVSIEDKQAQLSCTCLLRFHSDFTACWQARIDP